MFLVKENNQYFSYKRNLQKSKELSIQIHINDSFINANPIVNVLIFS